MLLNVLSREEDGCVAMRTLIQRSHESPKAKKAHWKRGWQLFRSLVDRKIIDAIGGTALIAVAVVIAQRQRLDHIVQFDT